MDSNAAWPPGQMSIIPIHQEEAIELAGELTKARRYISGSPYSREVIDRIENILRSAITLNKG